MENRLSSRTIKYSLSTHHVKFKDWYIKRDNFDKAWAAGYWEYGLPMLTQAIQISIKQESITRTRLELL